MNSNKRILIVDDSADDIRFVMATLTDDFSVMAATHGEKALEIAANSPQPEVILMDVEMPIMNGYETCKALKANNLTKDIDVIFLSSHDTIDEKLSGYEAGGSDYLTKPVQPVELLQKLKLIFQSKENQKEKSRESSSAFDTAMTAITNAGEFGIIVEFMRSCIPVSSVDDITIQVVQSVARFGLDSTVCIESSEGPVYYSSHDTIKPLEKELLYRIPPEKRIIEKENRLILNYGSATLLVRNMPNDSDRRGRLRDHLATLIEVAAQHANRLKMESSVLAVLEKYKTSLKRISDLHARQKKNSVQILDDLMKDIIEQFFTYGLTEEQEQVLLKMVEIGIKKQVDNYQSSIDIEQEIRDIIDMLSVVMK